MPTRSPWIIRPMLPLCLVLGCSEPNPPSSDVARNQNEKTSSPTSDDEPVLEENRLAPAANDPEAAQPSPTTSEPAGAGHDLLLITLDTTRTDALGCYGSKSGATPTLDRLAARGVVFEEAFTPAPMTLPAHATMLTGVLPPEHGARVNGEHQLADEVPSLAERLSEAGYRTGAFIAAFVLNHRFGLARGFDHYDDDLSGAYEQDVPSGLARYRPGNLVVDAALDWLSRGDQEQPFFAWIHLYDAHFPWFSHDDPTSDPQPGSGSYEGEIAFLDAQVQRLLSALQESQRLENTLVVAVADHGEGLGDHGEIEHAYLLNEEVLHVPWIMAGPGVKPGHRVSSLVSLEDLAPTLSEVLDLGPFPSARGRSLKDAIRGEEIDPGVSYAETDLPWTAFRWSPQRSLTTERWKYIRTPLHELYDRSSDREELINLVDVKAEVRESLESQLQALEEQLNERETQRASLSSEEIEELAALGYAVGGGNTDAEEGAALADVKERLPAKQLAARLREGIAKEEFEPPTLLQMAQQLVQMSPETPAFHGHLGTALVQNGLVEQGVRELELVLAMEPENAGVHYELGDVLQQHGLAEKARPHIEKALELEPKMPAGHVAMGNILRAEGRPDLAAGWYTEAISLREEYPEAHYNLALTFLDRGNPERAEEHFLQAVAQKPQWDLGHASLANLYANWGKGLQAVKHYQIALELAPQDPMLHQEFGQVLMALDQPEDARRHFQEALRLHPAFFQPHVQLGNLAFRAGDDQAALSAYQEALRLEPGLAETTAKLARFLATCPDPAFRDGPRAVALAERAADLSDSHPKVLDTLAAAYAENGDFAKAVSTAHQAQQRARQAGNQDLAQELEQRLSLYALEQTYTLPRPPKQHSSTGE